MLTWGMLSPHDFSILPPLQAQYCTVFLHRYPIGKRLLYKVLIGGFLHFILPAAGSDLRTYEDQNMANCVLNVLRYYFTSDRSILITAPNNRYNIMNREFDNGQEELLDTILQRINQHFVWSLQLNRPNLETLENNLEDWNNHNYVLLTWPDENDDISLNLITQMEEIMTKGSLHARSRFLVVVPHLGSQTPEDTALSILEELFNSYMILDVLVLVPFSETSVQPRTLVRNLHLYTRLPFHDSGSKVLRVNEWKMEQKIFSRDSDLFPAKMPLKMNSSPLKVATMHVEPVVIYTGSYTNQYNEKVYNFIGPEITILDIIVRHLNLSYYFVAPQNEAGYYDKVVGLIMSVASSNADIALGTLPLNARATEMADFLTPFFSSDLHWYVPCPKPFFTPEKLLAIFSLHVWILSIVVLISVATITYWISRFSNSKEHKHYRSPIRCFLSIWAIFLSVSAPKLPLSSTVRIFFLLFLWFSVAMNTIFQAFFTSFLLNPGVIDQIRTIEELLSSGVEYGYDRKLDNYLFPNKTETLAIKMLERAKDCVDYRKCLSKVINDGNYATLRSEIYAQYFVATTMPGRENVLCSLDSRFLTYTATMYLRKNSPYVEPFNKVLGRLINSGIINKMVDDVMYGWHFQRAPDSDKYDIETVDDSYFQFTTQHLAVSFYILIIGSSVCVSRKRLRENLAYIDAHFTFVADTIQQLESSSLSFCESMTLFLNAKSRLSVAPGKYAAQMYEKLKSIISRNPGYETINSVYKVLSGTGGELPGEFNVARMVLYNHVPVTSVHVERSFSAYKQILSNRRHKSECFNLETLLVVYCHSNYEHGDE
ncbi:hypothetical protein ANN_11178 [Periplaneta americana]|uniref:Ionotropic glutamate receptor C-terminal domain-containing protein n=1 Tax=Periplaneta americana TaxID=6978 RepID=A0ABQ8T510_PERAM|nr:hypothetical protein ANN_11178 [Periplaneta americana]